MSGAGESAGAVAYPDAAAIRAAHELVRRHWPPTRLVEAPSLAGRTGCPVWLKLETDLPTGSFKPRGAVWALSVSLARRRVEEVVASSTGNHGAAVAYAARLLGCRATIFLPERPNPVKRARIAGLGAALVERGRDITEAFRHASEHAARTGAYFLNDATDPDLPAGPATIGVEIFERLSDVEAVFVPMGDTALIRGIGAAARAWSPRTRIVGVQAERAPAYYLSWREGRAIATPDCDTIADGLATRTPDPGNVRAIRELVAEVRLVTEAEMLAAVRHLLFEEHVVAEPAGAAPAAALLAGGARPGGAVVALVSGANIAPDVLRRAVCAEERPPR